MDTVPQELDQERLSAGQEILRLTDQVGFGAYAAAWAYDRTTGRWRYVLSTPMLKSQGPRWVYDRLLKVFTRLPLPEGITPLDIFVIDPAVEAVVLGDPDVLSVGGIPAGLGLVISVKDADLGPFVIGFGFVSFLRRLPTAERSRNPARTFDRKVHQLLAA